ncbi:hypothetical protein SAMN05443094_11116 [Domibacillus enclensis]|uniref:Uncharacterized protein n=1 Tax=Domibacillus enclensis TaxID=1017273 RepID=A0A1N7C123_9BACI|nr:hypothetical protein SAMN05443094_11116 [Domibacillus enclensis]
MSAVLFMFIHLVIGLWLLFKFRELPKPLFTFISVFSVLSFIYWSTVAIRTFLA